LEMIRLIRFLRRRWVSLAARDQEDHDDAVRGCVVYVGGTTEASTNAAAGTGTGVADRGAKMRRAVGGASKRPEISANSTLSSSCC